MSHVTVTIQTNKVRCESFTQFRDISVNHLWTWTALRQRERGGKKTESNLKCHIKAQPWAAPLKMNEAPTLWTRSILAIIFSIAPRIDDWHVLHRSVMTLISLKKRNYRNKNSTDKCVHAIIHRRNPPQLRQDDPVLTAHQRGSWFLFNACSNQNRVNKLIRAPLQLSKGN